jgi:Tol biopolymer transport system component
MRPGYLWILLLAAGTTGAVVVDVREGTNLSVAVHPNNEYLVIDLLEGLWRLPISGGAASALVPAGSGIDQPRFSPDGEKIVFQRWLNDQWDLWLLSTDTGEIEPLTDTDINEREPDFAPDGETVVFASDRGGHYQLWSLELATGATTQITDEPGDARFPSFNATGELAYVINDGGRSSVRLHEGRLSGRTMVSRDSSLAAPSWRPGGDVLIINDRSEDSGIDLSLFISADEPIWRQMTETEDVFISRVGWLSPEEYVYAADGGLWRRRIGSVERYRILLFAGIDVPDLGSEARRLPEVPAESYPLKGINDVIMHVPSEQFAFSALGDIWLGQSNRLERLTNDNFTDASPQFSRDGDRLFFASDRNGSTQLWQIDLGSRQMLQISDESGHISAPRISEDGRFVAFVESGGDAPWDSQALKLIEIGRAYSSRSLSDRLFGVARIEWQGSFVRATASDGPAEPAYTHVFETDAGEPPSRAWSRAGHASDMADLAELRFRPAAATTPVVIQAGRLFDGTGDDYRYHVDIHIEGQRIRDVVARDRTPLPATVLDAVDLTVIPGFVDVHAHPTTTGSLNAGRRWLAQGVTTVREVTPDWLSALERAETWASGQQPGPRLVISPPPTANAIALAAESPILIGGEFAVLAGLVHAEANEARREPGFPAAAHLPSELRSSPRIALSPMGRTYGDVFAQISASGAYLASALGALNASVSAAGYRELSRTYERIVQSTGRLAIGTDAPAVEIGQGYLDELIRLEARGMPRDQILRTATAGGAIALGLSLDLGTVEPGRIADLIVVDGNPLNDLSDLSRIVAVVKDGVWYDAAALRAR